MSQAVADIKEREESLLCRTYGRYPLALARGKGARLWDVDGKEYVDLLAGIAVTALGHSHEELCAVVARQAGRLWHVSNLFYQRNQLDLAEKLLSTSHHSRVFFCNSGAEANEAAVKLARRYMRHVKQRDAAEIITLTGCFHGRTLGTLAATARDNLNEGFGPLPEGFAQVAAGDLEALRSAVTPSTAAVLLEVVQGEGGVVPLPAEYLRGVENLCRERDILFMCDEVQTGMCRTGKFWAFQLHALKPDIISAAKALANGLPMGAILATEDAARGFEPGSHATTFGGGELASAVAAKTVEILLRDKMAERAAALGEHLKNRLESLALRYPGKISEVRGLGLMMGIEFASDARKIWEYLLNRGYICNLCHEKILRLLPPLVVEQADLDAFAAELERALRIQ
ncbi:MAG: aspartate aminotransferase family protein [Desulfovibrio sp.]|nr:aspartate aminotransferase family protein [Desulfovibrio sp.]